MLLIKSYNFGIKAVIFGAIKTGRDKTQGEKKDTSSELKSGADEKIIAVFQTSSII